MAKVIHTPVIGRGARRALPTERTPESPAPSSAEDDVTPPPAPKNTVIDAHEARRIISQRDAAEQRAKAGESSLAEMKRDLDSLRKQAHQHGLDAGMEQAKRSAAEQRDAEAEQFQKLCSDLVEQQKQHLIQAEEAAVEIAFAATVKLLGRLHSDTALLEALVRQAMEQVLAREGLKIYLSPTDCRRMQALARRSNQDWVGVEFDADSRIEMGGCRIESRRGSLDARLELQVEELKKALLHATKSGQPAGKDRG